MRIGFMGLGKLGLPTALAIESKGHEVVGYDISRYVGKIIKAKSLPYREEGAQEALEKSQIRMVFIPELVGFSEIIFVPIQTPHVDKYEGITRLPNERKDFDYSFLKEGIRELSEEIEKQGEDKVVAIISTVLPGTIRRKIKPLLSDHVKLCYNPFFTAMGYTMRDFFDPEFVLCGLDNERAVEKLEAFYATIHDRPFIAVSIESAELAKVSYNTYITAKITIANTIMEICHKIPGANADDVYRILKMATQRVVSPMYMVGGMGDGGPCHPRDNIALSWLAKNLDLSHDIYGDLMRAREEQTEWLADLIMQEASRTGLQVHILGKAFKKGTNLEIGSPSILLKNILEEKGSPVTMHDPHMGDDIQNGAVYKTAAIFFIGTKHDEFRDFSFPEGSIVIDPWRYMPDNPGTRTIRIGEKKPAAIRISLLTPTRGRPGQMKRLWESADKTADISDRVEIVFAIDEDDKESVDTFREMEGVRVKATIAPRVALYSSLWNRAYSMAEGEICMQCADDIVFRSDGWDTAILDAFEEYPDRIALVYAFDGKSLKSATHPFLHRNWIETVGYFTPPYLVSGGSDVWLYWIIHKVDKWRRASTGRRRIHRVSSDILIEHMYWQRRDLDVKYDRIYKEKYRHNGLNQRMFRELEFERVKAAEKLKKFIMEFEAAK